MVVGLKIVRVHNEIYMEDVLHVEHYVLNMDLIEAGQH